MKREFLKMKLFAVALFAMLQITACADNDKIIQFEQLPQTARQFVKTHFSGKKIALVKMDNDIVWRDYDVVFADGTKVEFDSRGAWTDVECKQSSVPAAIIPEAIKQYVRKNFPATPIVKIERDKRGYEIKLGNGTEIEFNKKMQVIDIDF